MTCASLLLLLTSTTCAAAPPSLESLPTGARLRVGTSRLRHGGLIRALAFSPDSQLLASASHDQTVSLWEVSSGYERWRAAGHEGAVLTVAFSPTGKLLASGAAEGTIRFWETLTGKELFQIRVSADAVLCLAFSPDGKRLAAGGDDGELVLVDLPTRKAFAQLSQDRAIRCLAWSSDGKRLAINGVEHAITICGSEPVKRIDSFGSEQVQCLAFAPKGNHLVTREIGGMFRLWDCDRGVLLRSWQGEKDQGGARSMIYQIAYAVNGREVYAGTPTGNIEVWDPQTGTRRDLISHLHRARVTALALSPDGGWMASAGADHTIRLRRRDDFHQQQADLSGPILALARRGRQMALLVSDVLSFHDLQTGRLLDRAGLEGVQDFAWVGEQASALLQQGNLFLGDATGKNFKLVEKPVSPITALGAAGNYLATLHLNGSLILRDVRGTRLRELEGKVPGMKPILARSAPLLATVGREAQIRLWDAKTALARSPLPGHRGGTLTAAFSPQGTLLASGGRDSRVRLWNLDTSKQMGIALPHDSWVTMVAYSHSGTLLATGTLRGDVRVWDIKSAKLVREYKGHRGAITGLQFEDKDATLISSSLDTTSLVWDLSLGKRTP